MAIGYLTRATRRSWTIYSRYYGQDQGYKSHDTRYREAISRYLQPGMRLLDAGCGSEMGFTREFVSKVDMAVGIDIEPIKNSPFNPCALRGDLHRLPFVNSSFDIVISKSVLEHLINPETVFREFARVLKPNGILVILTPNQYDYVSLIARATPFWFHRWILSKLLQRNEGDTFPTYYRANSHRKLCSLLSRTELTPVEIASFNQYPAYFMFSPSLFLAGVFYERVTSRYRFLSGLRGWILAVGKKSGGSCSGRPLLQEEPTG
jgi:ubiquinone/menaquinone biosynthesis C-methylase UbiE